MVPVLLLTALFYAADPESDTRLAAILDRLSEEAEVFGNAARKVLAQETLVQKARISRRRLRFRIGKDAQKPPPPEYRQREIISDYGFSTFREAPESLHELRKVVSVDGKPVTSREKARATLTLGVTSDDDRLKKKLLLEFQQHGLPNAAVDLGQLIMLFLRRDISNYRFQITGERQLAGDNALVVGYTQAAGTESLTIYEGKQAKREPLEGEVWVRTSDYVPLRITLKSTTRGEDGQVTDHAAEVDYLRSGHGILLPASVRYEKHIGGELIVENTARYSSFSMFSVDAEIKFESEALPGQK
jgi:hypothetical protein